MIDICVALGDDRCDVYAYDLPSWGLWAEASTEEAALAAIAGGPAWAAFARFLERHGERPRAPSADDLHIVERRRVSVDEEAFERDASPTTDAELDRTLETLDWARSDLLAMISEVTDAELDWEDPDRVLPNWAWWRTPRQMALHIALTESHYYLRNLGFPAPRLPITIADVPTTTDLDECLRRSRNHVRGVLSQLPRDLSFQYENGQVWTTTKAVWRLAWHERSENDVIRDLLKKARDRLGSRE